MEIYTSVRTFGENISLRSTSLSVILCSNVVVISVPITVSVTISESNLRTISVLLSVIYVNHPFDTIDVGRSPVYTHQVLYIESSTHIVQEVFASTCQ